MMLHKVMRVLKSMLLLYTISPQKMTAGELQHWLGLSYSSVRRYLEIAQNSGLVDSELMPYKSTGKHVFWITEKGLEWVHSYRELI